MKMQDTEQKCIEIISWAENNSWALENFDSTTIRNICDDSATSSYSWPTYDQEKAVANVYKLSERAKKWSSR